MAKATGKSKKPRSKPVSDADFFLAVESSENAQEVANKTGLSVNTVTQRCSLARKHGVDLKTFRRGGGRKKDWDAAKQTLIEVRKRQAEANANADSE